MEEKRKEERFQDENEVIINIVPGEGNQSEERIPYNCSKDISASGAKMRGNVPLPVDSLLKIDLTLEKFHQKITTFGKVKWIKIIIEDKSYEVGVEFVNTADEAVKILKDYISWKLTNESSQPFQISATLNKV